MGIYWSSIWNQYIITTANRALAIWQGNEYILSFLFAAQLQFRQTNNAEQ